MNDVLVQLEKTCRYAERYGRTVIVDLSRSGLQCNFDELFVARDNFGSEVIAWSDVLGSELDALDSAYPTELTHRITKYNPKYTRQNGDTGRYHDEESDISIDFDFNTNYAEQLLVCEQGGGGDTALKILRRLAFITPVANEVARRLLPIVKDYDAMHIRHSDYKTDYLKLFFRAKTLFRGRSLLICSDSREVKDMAATYFEGFLDVLSLTDIPETGGVPLHISTEIDRHGANVDLLAEIVAMGRSKRFLFTQLSRDNELGYYSKFSGFAILVMQLKADPDVIEALFENGDPYLISQLFSDTSKSNVPSNLQHMFVRSAARFYERFWNRRALRKAAEVQKKVRQLGRLPTQSLPR